MVSLVDNLINVYDQYNKVQLADDKKGFLNKHWLTANGEIKTKTLGQRILARLCFTRKSFKEKNNISFKKLQGKLFEEFKDVTTHEQVLKMAKCLSIFETFREKKRYTASKKFTDKVVSGVIHKQMASIISYLELIPTYKDHEKSEKIIQGFHKDIKNNLKDLDQEIQKHQRHIKEWNDIPFMLYEKFKEIDFASLIN